MTVARDPALRRHAHARRGDAAVAARVPERRGAHARDPRRHEATARDHALDRLRQPPKWWLIVAEVVLVVMLAELIVVRLPHRQFQPSAAWEHSAAALLS